MWIGNEEEREGRDSVTEESCSRENEIIVFYPTTTFPTYSK
jgi:hypothetical protein